VYEIEEAIVNGTLRFDSASRPASNRTRNLGGLTGAVKVRATEISLLPGEYHIEVYNLANWDTPFGDTALVIVK